MYSNLILNNFKIFHFFKKKNSLFENPEVKRAVNRQPGSRAKTRRAEAHIILGFRSHLMYPTIM